MMKAH